MGFPRMPSMTDSVLGGSEMSKSTGSIQKGTDECDRPNILERVPLGKSRVMSETSTWKPVAQLSTKGATGGPIGSCIGAVRFSPEILPASYPPNINVPSACEFDSEPMRPQKTDEVRELIKFVESNEFMKVELDERPMELPRKFLLYIEFRRMPNGKSAR